MMLRSFTSSSRRTIRGLATVLAVVACVLVIDFLVAAGLNAVMLSSKFRFSELYAGRAGTDVAIFGNSRAVHTFYAPELGAGTCRDVTNFAFNGLSMAAVEALMTDYLERNPDPRVVVLEASSLYSDHDGASQLTPFMAPGSNLRTFLLSFGDTLFPWYKIFRSYRFNSPILLRTMAYLSATDQNWINRVGPIRQPGVAPPEGVARKTYDLRPENKAALLRIADTLKDRGIPLVLAVAPYHPSVTNQIENPYDWIEEIPLAEISPDAFLDLSKNLPGDAEYRDYLHLNLVGARALLPVFNSSLERLPACGSETGSASGDS